MRDSVAIVQIGVDVHRRFSMVSARGADGRVAWRQKLRHEDRTHFRESIARWPKGTPSVLEATFGWGWISDELSAAGLEPHLASSTKVAGWRKALGLAKSDRIDSDLLTELPMTPNQRWWEVWTAPPDVRERREWTRYRMGMVQMQTDEKCRIHAVLHRHGIINEHGDLFGVAGRKWLKELIEKKDDRLPASGRETLIGHLQTVDHIRRKIAQATAEIRRQLTKTEAGERLRSIPGIGWVLAYTIYAEIGDISRFPSAKHLVSYSLLAPRAYDSGKDEPDDSPRGRHLGKVGRRTLKWAYTEAAHSAIRHGGRFRKIYDLRTNNGKRDRNRGIIAVAHELCKLSYVVWKKNVNYQDTPPPRPGSEKRAKRSCSGTG